MNRAKKMSTKRLWEFPVPSTTIGDTKLIYNGCDEWLLFDYYDGSKDEILNSGIVFDAVQAHRHSCELFTPSWMDAYDYLVEVVDSEWVKQLEQINKEIADFWKIKHYAIYLKSNGLFEFIARGYEILNIAKGPLQ